MYHIGTFVCTYFPVQRQILYHKKVLSGNVTFSPFTHLLDGGNY